MTAARYVSAGLVIESDFALPGLSAAAVSDRPADLRYRRAAGPPAPPERPTLTGPDWSCDRTRFHLSVPDVADFAVDADGTVSVWPRTDTPGDIAGYLVGSVLGIALHFRKIISLHASAVAVDGGAVLFCGDSGAGKSTMAAALHQQGQGLLCDDLSAIDLSRDPAVVHPDGRKLKLWDAAIDRFDMGVARGQPVKAGYDKYFVDAGSSPPRPAPIRALYILSQGLAPRIVAVSPAEGAAEVRANAYRPFLVQQLQDERLYFRAAAALLRQAGIYRLERPLDFDRLPEVIAALKAHWRTF